MRQYFIEKYNARLIAPTANVARVVVPFDGTIDRLDIYTPNISGVGYFYFNLRVNGVAQFSGAGRPKLDATSKHAQLTGLAIDVADGDIVTFDFEAFTSGSIFAYSEYSFQCTDGVGVISVVAGANVTVDDTDPNNPIVASSAGGATDLDGLSDVVITSPANDDVLQRKAGSFVNRTLAQLKTDLAYSYGLDDLTDVVITSPANDDIIQRKAGSFVNRTLAQLIADLGLGDAMIFRGVIDCSANPNYPAANAGDTYKVSVAGRIGGGSGPKVEIADTLICAVDGTSSGTQAGVGANWHIVQANIDGAVIGPTSATDSGIVLFDTTTGKLIKDSAKLISIDGTLVGNSDGNVPTEKAVKTYVDAHAAAWTTIIRPPGNQAQGAVALADAYLAFSMVANKTYLIRGRLDVFINGNPPGFKYQMDFPASTNASVFQAEHFTETGGALNTKTFYKNPISINTPGFAGFDRFLLTWEGTLVTDGTGGTWSLAHAQQTSNASLNIIRGGFVEYKVLN